MRAFFALICRRLWLLAASSASMPVFSARIPTRCASYQQTCERRAIVAVKAECRHHTEPCDAGQRHEGDRRAAGAARAHAAAALRGPPCPSRPQLRGAGLELGGQVSCCRHEPAVLRAHADTRGAVALECARLLQSSPEQPVELFQIIGQDSYQSAVRKSSGCVLDKLLRPPRSLIVTPREEQGAAGHSCGADIPVPPQHSSRVFVLDNYKDEMVLLPPTMPLYLQDCCSSFDSCRCCLPLCNGYSTFWIPES